MKHGTRTRYNDGCRCEECVEENRQDSVRRRRAREAARVMVDGRPVAVGPEHGKVATYANWGCRCLPCTRANTDRSREARQRRRNTP